MGRQLRRGHRKWQDTKQKNDKRIPGVDVFCKNCILTNNHQILTVLDLGFKHFRLF